MTENTATAAPVIDSKTAIYAQVQAYVKARTGKNIGRSGGQELFNIVVEQIFAAATHDQTFRFNGGYGSLRIKHYAAGSRKLPSGVETTFGTRSKLRYEQGVTTTQLVEGKAVKTTPIPTAAVAEPVQTTAAPATEAPAATDASLDLE